MAWTQADADAIREAIASGELVVQHSDGRRITYRSINELKAALVLILEHVDPPSVPKQRRILTRPGW